MMVTIADGGQRLFVATLERSAGRVWLREARVSRDLRRRVRIGARRRGLGRAHGARTANDHEHQGTHDPAFCNVKTERQRGEIVMLAAQHLAR
jgi:hypothetical protein